MIQRLQTFKISSNFCYTACLNVSIVMCTKGTFNGPAPGWMEVFFYLQGYFHKSIITFPPFYHEAAEHSKSFICNLWVTIQLPIEDRPCLVRNIILPPLLALGEHYKWLIMESAQQAQHCTVCNLGAYFPLRVMNQWQPIVLQFNLNNCISIR